MGTLFAEVVVCCILWGTLCSLRRANSYLTSMAGLNMSLKRRWHLFYSSKLNQVKALQSVKSQSTNNIYIKPMAPFQEPPKSSKSGNLYTLTGDIYDQVLVVECNNIVVDGGGFTFKEQAAGAPQGW